MILDPIIRFLIFPVSGWLFVSGCDELFVDAWFAWKAAFGRDSWDVSLEKLGRLPEKRIAIFVPCWREWDVIEQMIDHNIAAIEYRNYEIFIGVYPNDPQTIAKAAALEQRYPIVHMSVCPQDGATNKADCLNWIYQRMRLEEERGEAASEGRRFEVIVQHDAEDLVHPHSFKLINYLTSQYDMVQIPVLPLETSGNLVHGTYCDEFAEYQLKDIYTRQSMGGFVPSAGVGTAFRRDALEDIATHYRNQIFNVNTLTEDYEIGLKFKRHGKRQFMVRKAIPVGEGGRAENQYGVEYIATREYFPQTFRNAVRQKSRWVMGVALQGWDQLGWRSALDQLSFRQLYWLWRDRKGLAGNPVTMLSNFIFFYCLAMWLTAHATDTGWNIAGVFPSAGFIWWLVPFNTFFIFERWFFRAYAVNRVYGPRQAIGVVWRTPLANVINFAATIAAMAFFFRAKLRREEVRWVKTEHAFPSREQLLESRGPGAGAAAGGAANGGSA